MAKIPRKSDFDFSGKWAKKGVEGFRKEPTIYLFRHAQTVFNKNRYFTGWLDSKLTPFGRVQAKVIARKLSDKGIDVAFHTSLSRSRDTLAEVLRRHPECRAVFLDDRMLERSYGKLSGTSHAKYEREHSAGELHSIRRKYDYPPPGGESIKMVERRVLAFVRDLIKYMRKNRVNVAISAHGNSMRPFRRHFEKLGIRQMMTLENPWDDYFEYKIKV
ncbi:MAG: histidine phosphatase family protein [Candidatus Micrarchaeia archaeon]|jgi:2,3-bisphosphoglycerate-dependent phosphoglycerate mutase